MNTDSPHFLEFAMKSSSRNPVTTPIRGADAGFTLMEILIVMAIIAMLAALVGPRLMKALSGSQVKTTRLQVEMLSTSLDAFRLDIGRYPTQEEGLKVLVSNPEINSIARWNGPYLRKAKLPTDSWNRDFIYEIPPKHPGVTFDLYSLGADGKLGGEGEDADIGNWE